jgi:penicillin V acylase-like amidase (Ntn superfamily)
MRPEIRSSRSGLALFFLLVFANAQGGACTAFVMHGRGAILLAKNLDWPVGEGYLFVNKRNVRKEAFGSHPAAPLRWVSKYGSVTFNQFGREFPLGGINEAGLVIEELSAPAEYPPADQRPVLNELQWIQYNLDCHGSLKELLKGEPGLRVQRFLFNMHYLVSDAKGDVAVIEFVKGKIVSYAGKDLPVHVLGNNGYADSLRYLKLHEGFGGERVVSNGPESRERFFRATTILKDYDGPAQRPLVDDAFVVLKSLTQEDTQWSIVYNIPRRLIFFKTRAFRRLKIVALAAFDFSCGSPTLMHSVMTDAAGNLGRRFVEYDPKKNQSLLDSVFRRLTDLGEIDSLPRDDIVLKMSRYPDTCLCR